MKERLMFYEDILCNRQVLKLLLSFSSSKVEWGPLMWALKSLCLSILHSSVITDSQEESQVGLWIIMSKQFLKMICIATGEWIHCEMARANFKILMRQLGLKSLKINWLVDFFFFFGQTFLPLFSVLFSSWCFTMSGDSTFLIMGGEGRKKKKDWFIMPSSLKCYHLWGTLHLLKRVAKTTITPPKGICSRSS